MKSIKEADVNGKRVLVRCDFNVSLDENGNISNDLRIHQAIPTIDYLVKKGAKVILLSHFKAPEELISMSEEREEGAKIRRGSIFPVKKKLEIFLKKEVKFVNDCIGKKVKDEADKMNKGDVLLLENTRIYKEEKENSSKFGKEISSLGDIFVNDAFSVSHRDHASVTKPPLYIPAFAGILMEREVRVLNKVQKNPRKPIIAIIGGAKIESKISVINYFLENADHVLLGGKIANMVLIVREITFNLPWPSKEIETVVREIDYTSPKLHIPVDVIAAPDNTGERGVRETAPAKVSSKEDIFDIGHETRRLYKDIISEAGTVIWAGPLGFSEREAFAGGTRDVGEGFVKNEKALKIIGGGDTSSAFYRFNLLDKVNLVSYGGGAMLNYIRKGPMPGIKALRE